MARNRMIKPEFWTSKTISKLSYEARLLFIGMWNFSDDYGVSLYNTRKILGDIFPNEQKINESKIEDLLQELMTQGLIYPVSYDESNYLIISSWEEHQIVPNPNKRRWLDEEIQENLDPNESLIKIKLDPNSPKGKGKGKKKGISDLVYSDIFESFWKSTNMKGSKREAFNQFEDRLKTHTLEDIQKAYEQLKKEKADSELKFWPDISGFLNSYFDGYFERSKIATPVKVKPHDIVRNW